MACVFLTWELGGGLGHMMNLLPLVQGLQTRGHRIVAALQDLSQAERVFGGLDVDYFQAPVKTGLPSAPIALPRSFAHVLNSVGFADRDELWAMASAWRHLLELVRPTLIIFEHSPTALLAARGLPARKALLGTGFCCPVDEYPLRDLRPWMPNASQQLKQDEDLALRHANEVLARWSQPPLERLSQLFREVDETFLATLPELDHYQGRKGTFIPGLYPNAQEEKTLTPCPSPGGRGETRYWGAWPNVGGKGPQWPQGRGKRIFAYLKPFPGLPRLLQQLCDLNCPTIVYGDEVDADLRNRFRGSSIRYEDQRLDLAEAGKTCDLAILNGTHGTSFSMLLAGKPILQIPIALEQGILSQTTARLGAAVVASFDRPLDAVRGLMKMLGSDRYAEAARQFAARYADYDPKRQVAAAVDRVEELL